MPEGIYKFTVLEVHTTDKFNNPLCDKNGIEMAKLKLVIFDENNRERTLFTFISGDGIFAYKLRHFAKNTSSAVSPSRMRRLSQSSTDSGASRSQYLGNVSTNSN